VASRHAGSRLAKKAGNKDSVIDKFLNRLEECLEL
jgi:hypothetical protein